MRSITGPRTIGELFRFFPAAGREGAAAAVGAVGRLWRALFCVEDDDAAAWGNLLVAIPVFGGIVAAAETAARGAAAAWVAGGMGATWVDLAAPEAPPVIGPDAKAFTPLKA